MNNKFKTAFFTTFCLLCSMYTVYAQGKLKNYQIKGYVKNLQNVSFNTIGLGIDSLISGNTLHHRFNFKWYVSDELTFAAELRNQLFIGEQVKTNPQFGETIGLDAGLVDLSFNWIDKSAMVFNTQIDRLWLNWEKKKWTVRIGRQRINWGLNLAFNPNDLFNTYNFLDFDYEERPGTDALKITFNKTYSTSFELVASPNFNNADESIVALKYGFNKWQYDFQMIGGYYKKDIALGVGWAGNLKNAGFKGEAAYFIPTTPKDSLNKSNLNVSLTYDNVFGKAYFQAAALYNLRGLAEVDPLVLFSLAELQLSPKNLFPFRYSALITSAFTINPLSTATVGLVYSPGVNTLILTPSLSYSIVDNWDLNLFVQSFFSEFGKFKHLTSSVFLRLKWSY